MKRLFVFILFCIAAFGPADAGLHLHGMTSAYEGLVASRSRMIQSNAPDTTNKYMMARSAHIATENLSSIKLAFSNFYNAGNLATGSIADIGLGASATITASIEYPAATFTQVTFSASATGTISDIGVLFSDYVPVNIPAGATFWMRTFWHNTAGCLYNTWQNSFLGEATALSTTVISDQTMSGTITNSGSFSYPPLAVLGMTTNASVIIVGDSIGAGFNDTEDSSASATGRNAKVGLVARSMGSTPFLNLSVAAESANNFLTDATARKLLIPKGSSLITQLGTNDVAGLTPAQLLAKLQAIWALKWANQKNYQTTITPNTSTSDGWITGAGQTPAASNPTRITFNTNVRAILSGSTGSYDLDSALESSLNSGLWIFAPSPPYTGDGLHPNTAGYAVVQAANLIPAATYP